jgi:hypothetical protein
MTNKVTNIIVDYPDGQAPTFTVPEAYGPDRFLLGKTGKEPLVVIGMNPSAARDTTSDRTVSKIIRHGLSMGYDGWTVMNTYPERATDAKDMSAMAENKILENVQTVEQYLLTTGVTEVWGAWGDLKYPALVAGRDALLTMLKRHGIKVYYFGTLTKAGNPRHPLYMSGDLVDRTKKQYFTF